MAIAHAQPAQPFDVRPLGARLAQERTVALFKSADLEVMRLVLPAGRAMPEHRVSGELTVQCIEGEIDITCQGRSHVLQAGQMLYLEGGAPHGVVALQDSSVLVTVVVRR